MRDLINGVVAFGLMWRMAGGRSPKLPGTFREVLMRCWWINVLYFGIVHSFLRWFRDFFLEESHTLLRNDLSLWRLVPLSIALHLFPFGDLCFMISSLVLVAWLSYRMHSSSQRSLKKGKCRSISQELWLILCIKNELTINNDCPSPLFSSHIKSKLLVDKKYGGDQPQTTKPSHKAIKWESPTSSVWHVYLKKLIGIAAFKVRMWMWFIEAVMADLDRYSNVQLGYKWFQTPWTTRK